MKKKVVPWATERYKIKDKLLCEVEEEIACLFLNNSAGIFSNEEVVTLKSFEVQKKVIARP
jgi:hypothetical protein